MEIRPLLDDALSELKESDRMVILARYFEGAAMADIARRNNVSENAARMRVDRSLERLRSRLEKRGIKSTGAALAGFISEGAVVAAPAGLAATISGTSLSSAALAGAGGVAAWEALKIAAIGKLSSTLILLGMAATTVTFVAFRHRHTAGAPVSRAGQAPLAARAPVHRSDPGPSALPSAPATKGPPPASNQAGSSAGMSKQALKDIRAHFLADYAVRYAGFIRDHHLTPEKAKLFLELQVDKITFVWEEPLQLGDGSQESGKAAAVRAYNKDQALLSDLLGEGGLDSLKAYDTAMFALETANKAMNAVDPSNQLAPDVRESATTLMAQFNPYTGIADHITDSNTLDETTKQELLTQAETHISAIGAQLTAVLPSEQVSAWEQWARSEVSKQVAFADSVIKANQGAQTAPMVANDPQPLAQ